MRAVNQKLNILLEWRNVYCPGCTAKYVFVVRSFKGSRHTKNYCNRQVLLGSGRESKGLNLFGTRKTSCASGTYRISIFILIKRSARYTSNVLRKVKVHVFSYTLTANSCINDKYFSPKLRRSMATSFVLVFFPLLSRMCTGVYRIHGTVCTEARGGGFIGSPVVHAVVLFKVT